MIDSFFGLFHYQLSRNRNLQRRVLLLQVATLDCAFDVAVYELVLLMLAVNYYSWLWLPCNGTDDRRGVDSNNST